MDKVYLGVESLTSTLTSILLPPWIAVDPLEQYLEAVTFWLQVVGVASALLYGFRVIWSRVEHYWNFVTLTVKTGHFTADGKLYFRETVDSPLYRVELKKSKGADPVTGNLCSPEYEYTPVHKPFIGFLSESTLTGAAPVSRLKDKALPAGLVTLFDGDIVAGVGFRYDDRLVTARHLIENVQDLWVQGSQGRVQIVNPVVQTPPVENFEHTGADVCTVEIPQKAWSQISCKALHRGQLSSKGNGRVVVYGADREGLYQSTGELHANGKEQKTKGTIGYRVNTLPGFSGSPVLMRNQNGQMSIVGMHICGDYSRENRNHGVCASALSLMLNGTVSPGEKVTTSLIMSESALPGDRQELFDDWNLLSFERQAIEQLEREEIEAEEWERICGDDFEGSSQRKAPKKKDAARMYRGFNERNHVEPVTGYEYSAPPNESPGDRKERLTMCMDHPQSLLIEDYKKAVQAHAPHHAPMLTGFFTGQRAWKMNRDDSSTTLQPRVQKRDATPEDIRTIFQKVCEGDHSAFIDVTQFTYASLVDGAECMSLFEDFRNYRDHGRGLISQEKKSNLIFKTKDGVPFFRVIGHTKGSKKKNVRDEAIGLTEEDKKLLRSLQIEDEFKLPPNTESAILKSMEAQAAKQIAAREYPLGPDMLDSWIRAMELNVGEEKPEKLCFGVEALNRIFFQLDNKSSGWTSRFINMDKKATVTKYTGQISRIIIGRLLARACLADEIPSMTPEEMFHHGLADPAQIFIKEEPHGAKKVEQETWRMIHCTSLIDACCQSYLGNELNKLQIADYQGGALVSHTSGMGHHDAGIAHMGKQIERLFPSGLVCCADASGWDLSVSRDAILADAMQRVLRVHMVVDARQSVGTAIGLVTDKLVASCHLYATGDFVWAGDVYGVTSSGSPDTTSQNSFMRGLGAILAGARTPMDAGDDLVTSAPTNDAVLKGHGTLTKEGATVVNWRRGEVVSFTSHDYRKDPATGVWSARFCNFAKCVHRLLLPGTTPTEDQLGGVAFAMRHTEEQLATLRALCIAKGWVLPPEDKWSEDEDLIA